MINNRNARRKTLPEVFGVHTRLAHRLHIKAVLKHTLVSMKLKGKAAFTSFNMQVVCTFPPKDEKN